MEGKVKWFSTEKGYGFIFGIDGEDRYFSVRDVKGANLPGTGDIVMFDPAEGKKGPRARNVILKHKLEDRKKSPSDGRVRCNGCGRKMVPRVVFWHGEPQKSICPFCGEVYKQFKSPFEIDWRVLAIILAVVGAIAVAYLIATLLTAFAI